MSARQSAEDTAAELRARWPDAAIQVGIGVFDLSFDEYNRTRARMWQYPIDGTDDWRWACDASHRDHSAETDGHPSAVVAAEASLRALVASFYTHATGMAERIGKILGDPPHSNPHVDRILSTIQSGDSLTREGILADEVRRLRALTAGAK